MFWTLQGFEVVCQPAFCLELSEHQSVKHRYNVDFGFLWSADKSLHSPLEKGSYRDVHCANTES